MSLATKHQLFVMHGSGWLTIMTVILRASVSWVNKQHNLIPAVNRHALKCSAEKSVSCARGMAFNIPRGNLVSLCDPLEG